MYRTIEHVDIVHNNNPLIDDFIVSNYDTVRGLFESREEAEAFLKAQPKTIGLSIGTDNITGQYIVFGMD